MGSTATRQAAAERSGTAGMLLAVTVTVTVMAAAAAARRGARVGVEMEVVAAGVLLSLV